MPLDFLLHSHFSILPLHELLPDFQLELFHTDHQYGSRLFNFWLCMPIHAVDCRNLRSGRYLRKIQQMPYRNAAWRNTIDHIKGVKMQGNSKIYQRFIANSKIRPCSCLTLSYFYSLLTDSMSVRDMYHFILFERVDKKFLLLPVSYRVSSLLLSPCFIFFISRASTFKNGKIYKNWLKNPNKVF